MHWKAFFKYDEDAPSCLRWLDGSWAGTLDVSHGYYKVSLGGSTIYPHRVIYEMLSGEALDGRHVDHFDGVKSNNRFENLRAVAQAVNTRNSKMHKNNKSGVTGVSKNEVHGRRTSYWQAAWTDLSGKSRTKSFPIHTLGDEGAFRMACEYRSKMIEQLNAEGANYSESHGRKIDDKTGLRL